MMGLIGGTKRGIFRKKSHSSVGKHNIEDNGYAGNTFVE